MDITAQQIAELEKSHYVALVPMAKVTPGMSLYFRDEVILSSNDNLLDVDIPHACLLRTSSEEADDLIAEIIDYFKIRNLRATVFISRACAPTDIGLRLLKHGFTRHKEEEAWLILETLQALDSFSPMQELSVTKIDETQTVTFAEVMLTAFGLSANLAPLFAQSLVPSIAVPEVSHFLGFVSGMPVATCTLIRQNGYGVMSEIGVVPAYRESQVGVSLGVIAMRDALEQGVEKITSQITTGTLQERYLYALGFKRAFTRVLYMLS